MKVRLSKTARFMLAGIGVLFLILLAGGILVNSFLYRFEKTLPYAFGLLTGCLLSVVKVTLMERSIGKSLDMQSERAKNYAQLQMIARYGLTLAVLLLAALVPDVFGLIGMILGILSLQLSSYIAGFLLRKDDVNRIESESENQKPSNS